MSVNIKKLNFLVEPGQYPEIFRGEGGVYGREIFHKKGGV